MTEGTSVRHRSYSHLQQRTAEQVKTLVDKVYVAVCANTSEDVLVRLADEVVPELTSQERSICIRTIQTVIQKVKNELKSPTISISMLTDHLLPEIPAANTSASHTNQATDGDRQVVELQVHAEHDDPDDSTSTDGLAGVETGSRSIPLSAAAQSLVKDMSTELQSIASSPILSSVPVARTGVVSVPASSSPAAVAWPGGAGPFEGGRYRPRQHEHEGHAPYGPSRRRPFYRRINSYGRPYGRSHGDRHTSEPPSNHGFQTTSFFLKPICFISHDTRTVRGGSSCIM